MPDQMDVRLTAVSKSSSSEARYDMTRLHHAVACLCSKKTRQCLFIALLIVLIWFAGPILSLGGWYPLDNAAFRLGLICVLLVLVVQQVMGWPFGMVPCVVLCLLIWYGGPYVHIGSISPLHPAWVRGCMIILLVAVWNAGRIRLLCTRLHQAGIVRHALPVENGEESGMDARIEKHTRILQAGFHRAMQYMHAVSTDAGMLARFKSGYRGKASLPWYMVMGAHGSGKSSLIQHSGLEFPLDEHGVRQDLIATENNMPCRWWMTSNSVLMDTCGDDCLHEVHDSEGKITAAHAQWQALLQLMKQYRPRLSVNGLVLVVSIPDLLDESTRMSIAQAVQRRMKEMRHVLGIRFPVYMLVNKIDYLQGFRAYFNTLTEEERHQIWGCTFDYGDEIEVGQSMNLVTTFRAAYKALVKRLDQGLVIRMDEACSVQDRRQLYAMPEEFNQLGRALEAFITQAFPTPRYDATLRISTLRGVYFCSALQDGVQMPIDEAPLFRHLAQYGQSDVKAAPVGVPAVSQHSYFIKALCERIILPESTLVCLNLVRQRQWQMLWYTTQLLVVCGVVWFASMLAVSYQNNDAYLDTADNNVAQLEKQAGDYRDNPGHKQLAHTLHTLQEVPVSDDLELDDPALSYRYGLYMAPRVSASVDTVYLHLYRKLFLPRLRQYITQVLETAIRQNDVASSYDALQVYLMLFDRTQFDPDVMRLWLMHGWASQQGDNENKAWLETHMERFILDETWYKPLTGRDDVLVDRARHLINRSPLAVQLYRKMKDTMMEQAPQRLTLEHIIGHSATRVLTVGGTDDQASTIPGLFTHEGYRNIFQVRLGGDMSLMLQQDARITGQLRADKPEALVLAVRRLYLEEYARRWQAFLTSIRTVSANTNGWATHRHVADVMAGDDAPLEKLVDTAVRQTTLSGHVANSGLLGWLASIFPALFKQTDKHDSKLSAASSLEKEIVSDTFQQLRQTASATGKTKKHDIVSLDTVSTLLQEYRDVTHTAVDALSAGQMPPETDLMQRMHAVALQQPAPIRQILADLSGDTGHTIQNEIGRLIYRQADRAVGQLCRQMTHGKYPFARTGQDMDLNDFMRLFGVGGALDTYFSAHLANYVDTSSHPWAYKTGMAMHDAPPLGMFEHAEKIRAVLFKQGDAAFPRWQTRMRIVEMDPGITQLIVDVDGQIMRYRHGPILPVTMTWPGPRGGSMASMSVSPTTHSASSLFMHTGPWSLLHLLDAAHLVRAVDGGKWLATYAVDQRQLVLEIMGGQDDLLSLLREFTCLPMLPVDSV
jgi:type VI secretion system protein ImpL